MKMLLYCVKGKPYLFKSPECMDEFNKYYTYNDKKYLEDLVLNGKVVAECDFEVEWCDTSWYCNDFIEHKGLEKSCLTKEQLFDYVKGRNEFYAIHIKNLHIFDEPRELGYYYTRNDDKLKSAPQNMCYCNEWSFDVEKIKENNGCMIKDYILISIKPEHLVNIFNGNKTIEIRKKILNKMKE